MAHCLIKILACLRQMKYLYFTLIFLSVLPSVSLRSGPCSAHLFTHLCQSAYPGRGQNSLQSAQRDCHLRGLAVKKRPAKCNTNNSCTLHMDKNTWPQTILKI